LSVYKHNKQNVTKDIIDNVLNSVIPIRKGICEIFNIQSKQLEKFVWNRKVELFKSVTCRVNCEPICEMVLCNKIKRHDLSVLSVNFSKPSTYLANFGRSLKGNSNYGASNCPIPGRRERSFRSFRLDLFDRKDCGLL